MTDLNTTAMIDDLTQAGLTPIIIDESTDMDALTDIIETDATETDAELVDQTTLDRVQLATKLLSKGFAKLDKFTTNLTELEALRDETKQQVADAMAMGGIGFDAASKAFRQANNKFDRALDNRDAQLNDLKAGIATLRVLLNDMEAEIDAMQEE